MVILKTLDEALNLCSQILDCGGITLHNENYELRKGPEIQQNSEIEEISWIKPENLNHQNPQDRPHIQRTDCIKNNNFKGDIKFDEIFFFVFFE